MKKNGFIATSLIYSFFLIFITLFLAIITESLQQKLWLNEIEKGIKDEINSSMGIKDFEVGDMINISKSGENPEIYSYWVIANIDYGSKNLILYSFDFNGTVPSCSSPITVSVPTDLVYNNLINDINSGYMNYTYFNKIIYTFDNSTYKNYKLPDSNYANYVTSIDNLKGAAITCKKADQTICLKGEEGCVCKITSDNNDSTYGNDVNYMGSSDDIDGEVNEKQRKRVVLELGDNKLTKQAISVDGTIMLSC